jgi:hypothetical protein
MSLTNPSKSGNDYLDLFNGYAQDLKEIRESLKSQKIIPNPEEYGKLLRQVEKVEMIMGKAIKKLEDMPSPKSPYIGTYNKDEVHTPIPFPRRISLAFSILFSGKP